MAVPAAKGDDDFQATTQTTQPSTQVLEAFPKDLWTANVWPGYSWRTKGNPNLLGMATAGVNGYFVDRISIGPEISAVYAPQPGFLDATGLGLAFNVRGHFLEGKGWSVYGETSMGLIDFNHQTPDGGTNFSFSVGLGMGGTLRLSEKTNLMLGMRYYHISNAGLGGIHHNPSYNGGEVYCGLMFKL